MEIYGGATRFDPPFERGPFIEILIRNSLGRRAGYDRKSNRIYNEFSNSCYVEEGLGNMPRSKNLVLINPPHDSYNFTISASENGIYRIKVDMTWKDEFISNEIAGLALRGDTQEGYVFFDSVNGGRPNIGKNIDVDLLKRELEITLKRTKFDRKLGKELVKGLMQLDRALSNRETSNAKVILRIFINRLEAENLKYQLRNENDIREWFADFFIENPHDYPHILSKQELFFSNINNIRKNKREEWFVVEAIRILQRDAEAFLENLY
ncbi:MAG: hypothetical protein JW803_09585 [Endomicrobiales bacterium]|nr:hypothetical protein [Endomicrobiales bacterium]